MVTMQIYSSLIIYSLARNLPESKQDLFILSKSQAVPKAKDVSGELSY